MERPDDRLLHRVHVLIFINDDVLDAFGQSLTKVFLVGQDIDCGFENRGVVEIAPLVQEMTVRIQSFKDGATDELAVLEFRFTENRESRDETSGIHISA